MRGMSTPGAIGTDGTERARRGEFYNETPSHKKENTLLQLYSKYFTAPRPRLVPQGNERVQSPSLDERGAAGAHSKAPTTLYSQRAFCFSFGQAGANRALYSSGRTSLL